MPCLQRELKSVDAYLERMGVRDPQLRARVEGGLPWAPPGSVATLGTGATALGSDCGPWRPLNAAAEALHDAATEDGGSRDSRSALAPLFLITDGTGGEAGACCVLADMGRACFMLRETQACQDTHIYPSRQSSSQCVRPANKVGRPRLQ